MALKSTLLDYTDGKWSLTSEFSRAELIDRLSFVFKQDALQAKPH